MITNPMHTSLLSVQKVISTRTLQLRKLAQQNAEEIIIKVRGSVLTCTSLGRMLIWEREQKRKSIL